MLKMEWCDRPLGIGMSVWHEGQGEAGRGMGVEHFGQGLVGGESVEVEYRYELELRVARVGTSALGGMRGGRRAVVDVRAAQKSAGRASDMSSSKEFD